MRSARMWMMVMVMVMLTSKVLVGKLHPKPGATHFCASWRTADAGCWMRQGRKDPNGLRVLSAPEPATCRGRS